MTAPAARAGSTDRPLSLRLTDWACLVFALWTLCSFATVLVGGTLHMLLWLFAVVVVLGWLLRARLLPAAPPDDEEEGDESAASAVGSRRPEHLWAAVAALLAIAMLGLRPGVVFVWWCAVAVLAAALFLVVRERPRLIAPAHGRAHERWLWALAVACVVVALVSHRPDADDAQYVNFAVSAADLPEWSLLSDDTLHGVPGLPLVQPVYRCHSYELWNGALSYLTGIPAIYCFHWISASLAALLLPLTWARLFRILTPARWLAAVGVFVLVLLAAGETHRWYGNFSLVRIWQGKALFLFVFMPLVYTHAVRFGLRPNRRDWLLLCAAQIAAMGSSSSALWCAPFGAAVAFASVWRPNRRGLQAMVLVALASAVLILAGISLKGKMASHTERISQAPDPPHLEEALHIVLGDGRLLVVSLVCVFAAWWLCRTSVARRLLVTMPLLFLVFLFNPYTARLVAAHVTGPAYWRSLWAVPVPLFITFVLLAPMTLSPSLWRRWPARLAVAGAFVAFAAWVPRYHGLSPANAVTLHLPGLKVPIVEYDLARRLQAAVSPRAFVVAPDSVNAWLTTFHHHAYPLNVRNYLSSRRMRSALGSADVERRRSMVFVATGRPRASRLEDEFRRGLDDYRVEGVCLRPTPRARWTRQVLAELGFRRIYVRGDYELWTRRLDPT